jgi:ubiquinone/menaquinone biosynthesis C-methylase UbiE
MDLKYLPEETRVIAVDLTPTMVRRTAHRSDLLDRAVTVACADAQTLPFAADTFDAVLLHLVLSVVPDPGAVVSEAARVLSARGRISLYDKFQPATTTPSIIRRLANPFARVLFADLNRPLQPMLSGTSLITDHRETFLGRLYTVTIAHPAATE